MTTPDIPLLERLSGDLAALRTSERKVAALVAQDPQMVVRSTMAVVAEAAGVSEPTVMRFCTNLGFDGFQAFKLALAQALALGMPVTHSALALDDGIPELTGKIFDHTISSLDRARRYIDNDAIAAAADILYGATSIVFVGFGASAVIAQDAEQKFALFGVPCSAPEDPHQQFMAATMSNPGTVIVAISNTGRTTSVIRVATEAQSRGLTVIGLSGEKSPLLEHCDIGVIVKTFEDTDTFTPTVSRLAGLVVVDVLATAVAMKRGAAHLDRIRQMKEALTSFRSDSTP
jgi:RpiR family carbohydrate utilization transcriptional regulator